MTLAYLQSNTQYLAGSGVLVGATTLALTSLTDIYGNAITSMTPFGTKGYITLEPDTTNEEAATFTSVTVNANGTVTLGGVSTVLAQTPYTETSGLVRGHSGGTKVVITDNVGFWNTFTNKNNNETVTGQWTFTNTPITPPAVSDASTTVKGVTKLSVAPAVASSPIAVGVNDTTIFAPLLSGVPSGVLSPYAGYTAPTGWLLCDGTAYSRSTYASLFSILCPSAIFTVTIASPGVFSSTAHGLLVGDKIHFTTTGALPTGLSTNTDYYVISAGFTANAFEVALSPGGPAINTTGSQSGVQTFYKSNFGKGDGSSTFNVPDLRQRIPIAIGQSSYSFSIDSSNVTLASPSVFTVPANAELYQGQAIVLSTSGTLPTGFTPGNTYYVIRATGATTFTLASSQALANTGTGVNGSVSQSGIHTVTYTPASNRTILGRVGGEETHGQSQGEMAAHTHSYFTTGGVASPSGGASAPNASLAATTGSNGSDTQHNNMSPFITTTYIIKQ